jgi:hypothetical protein
MSSAWASDGTAPVKYRGANWTALPALAYPHGRQLRTVSELVGNRLLVTKDPEPSLSPYRTNKGSPPMEIAIVLFRHRRHLHHRSIKVVPQQNAWVVERLGKYHGTLTPGPELPGALHRPRGLQAQPEGNSAGRAQPGLHHADNTQLQVDGILYFQVTDPMRASYGSSATTSWPSRSWRRPRCAA